MKRVFPRVSRQFPEEFYSDDRQLSQQQSAKQPSSAAKNIRESGLPGSPSQYVSTFEDESGFEITANFNHHTTGMRVSQSQDNLFKQTQFEKKKQMEFTFCLADNKKNPLRQTLKMLPPLLQNQNKVFNSLDCHPLTAYQLDQYVKPHIKRVSPQQLGLQEINKSDSDSLTKMTSDQTQIEEQQTVAIKEETSSPDEKQQNINSKLRQQSYSVLAQDLRRKQRNIANLISNTNNSAIQQSQQVSILKKNINQINPCSSILSSTSNLENIHPNICQSNILTNMGEQNQTKTNAEQKTRQYYASPASNSLSRSRDPLAFQQKISTITNPTRQSYQSLQKGELKINQNLFNPNQQNQQYFKQINSSTIEDDYYNHLRNKQSETLPITVTERAQMSASLPKPNLGLQNKFIQQGLSKKNIASINFKKQEQAQSSIESVEQNDVQIKLSNNSKITSLPVLNMIESYQQKNQRDLKVNNTLDHLENQDSNNKLFKNSNSYLSQVQLSTKNNTNGSEYPPFKPRTNSMQNALVMSPSQLNFSEKQKFYRTKNPQNYISSVIQNNSAQNTSKPSYTKSILGSPQTVPVKPTNQTNLTENQLDKLHSPEWFYSQLGRPNLFSYQEKRQKAIQHYQRNIQSQQAKEEECIPLIGIKTNQRRLENLNNKNINISNSKNNNYFNQETGYINCKEEEDFSSDL